MLANEKLKFSLREIISVTESMDETEKRYWTGLIPDLTEDHILRLYTILKTEQIKLEELEERARAERLKINERHLIEWQSFQRCTDFSTQ